MNKTITAQNAPAAVGPYCHAKLVGNMLFTSGQLGLIPATGELPEGVQAQATQALENLKAVLAAAGAIKTMRSLQNGMQASCPSAFIPMSPTSNSPSLRPSATPWLLVCRTVKYTSGCFCPNSGKSWGRT